MINNDEMIKPVLSNDHNLQTGLQFFQKILGVTHNKTNEDEYYIGGWVLITAQNILLYLNKIHWNSHRELEWQLLVFLMEKINRSGYGASCCYELYESRRQCQIKAIINRISGQISEDHLSQFKKEIDYEEFMDPYCSTCDHCRAKIDASELARSLQFTGLSLCYSCYHKEMS